MADETRSRLRLPGDLLRGRVALVTGGARGIGRATSLRLAEAGANIVINYARNQEAAQETAMAARAFGVEAHVLQADVAEVDQAASLVNQAVERFGRLDIVVANAGIWEGAPVEEMSEELWDRVVDVNLKGTWTVSRAAVPVMKRERGGSIIIVSSTAGQRGEAGYSSYAASKGGQISFTKALAAELAPDIRVNCVAPGWVETDLNDGPFADGSFKSGLIDGIPLGRIATADDIAIPIVFLASDWSRHITGEVLNINGGAVLCG
jgi:3-oxoacyl-[acyl-carrier protein] reductase